MKTQSSETGTATSTPPPPPRRVHKKGDKPRPPQPGRLDPPWPDSNPNAGPQRRKIFTSQKGLIDNAVFAATVLRPYISPFPQTKSKGKPPEDRRKKPVLALGVPKSPDFAKDYTNMGPNVSAPWRKGGVFRMLSDSEIKATSDDGDVRRYKNSHSMRVRYTKLHSLHPFSANFLAASPGVEDNTGASDGQGFDSAPSGWPVGFPHPFAEVVRRRYAIKNRTEPLWWFTVAHSSDPNLPLSNLVRDRMRNKLQGALKAALERRGYAPNGIRLDGKAGAKAKYSHMYGSLRVEGGASALLKAPFDELVGFLAQAVILVERQIGVRGQKWEH